MPRRAASFPTPAPVIAQLLTPTTVLYELEVFTHNGFLTTRRRRGLGPPQPLFHSSSNPQPYDVEYLAYQHYFHPVFNELALGASGLSRETIEQWLTVPGNDATTHPEYAALCLRWGENATGVFVQPYKIPAGNQDFQVGFVPYSCWQSGVTYYRLCAPHFEGSRQEKALHQQGILRPHAEQLETEGSWHGTYTTDWHGLRRALTALRMTPVLVQEIATYLVSLQTKPRKTKWSRHFYLESEADELYAQFPENPAYDAFQTDEYPRLVRGISYAVRNYPVHGGYSGEKIVFLSALTQKV